MTHPESGMDEAELSRRYRSALAVILGRRHVQGQIGQWDAHIHLRPDEAEALLAALEIGATWAAQKRTLADPSRLAKLQKQLDELNERHGGRMTD